MLSLSEPQLVHLSTDLHDHIKNLVEQRAVSGVFVLCDTHTQEACLPLLLPKLELQVPLEIIVMEAGEENKSFEISQQIWRTLSELGADRKSLLINLGGGVVTDLGGFVAATFKRGIACVQVPTTLLAMVDAALGGKNGVNLGSLKNQVGTVAMPLMTLIDPQFLQTLSAKEMRSGLAEMLKHGLIADRGYWDELRQLDQLDLSDLERLIWRSVEIKSGIVLKDPTEQHLRKSLNFGHTLGHAIESYFLEKNPGKPLLHGEAIAVGMVLASYLSVEQAGLCREDRDQIKAAILARYEKISIEPQEIQAVTELLKFDKKNENGNINFVLLRRIADPVLDCQVTHEQILEAFEYYLE